MGADFYPKVLIGVRVPTKKVFKLEKKTRLKTLEETPYEHQGKSTTKPKCPDFEIRDGITNCPYCGCSLYKTYSEPVIFIPELKDVVLKCEESYSDVKWREWTVARSTSDNYYFIGFYHAKGHHEDDCSYDGIKLTINTDEIETKKEELKMDLEEIGLWDETQFGLWLFMFNSY